MTYLEAVNDLLIRLREPTVASVGQTSYSRLLGKLINDSKRRVENIYNWNALTATCSISTVADTFSYELIGANDRSRVIDVINDSSNSFLKNAPIKWLNQQYLISPLASGSPSSYGLNGVSINGYLNIDLHPIPNGAETIRVNLYQPQNDLTLDAQTILVPYYPVIAGAYAMALLERGEDQGMSSSEAIQLYNSAVSDAIAIESSRYVENDSWEAV